MNEPTMAFYTGSDILANRGSPHFGAESPDGLPGPWMALPKWQWQEQEAGREGHNKNPGICKENPKNLNGIGQFLTHVKILI